jgi:nucleoside-diphosphate-sugar epimerase
MRPNDGRVVSNFIVQALRGEPLTVYGDGSQTRSFCHVSDEVEGIYRLFQSDQVGLVNIGNPIELAVGELARKIIEITGSSSTIDQRPLPVDDPKVRKPDITLARTAFGWEPSVTLDAGLRDTIPYFRKLIELHDSVSRTFAR